MATKLKVLRAEHNLTQEDLAEILGTNQKVISTWESGKSVPRPAMMQKNRRLLPCSKGRNFFCSF